MIIMLICGGVGLFFIGVNVGMGVADLLADDPADDDLPEDA